MLILALIVSLAVLGVGLLGRQREANRSIGEGEVKESLNSFSFDLLSKLDFNRENTFFSPISVYSALAMTYEGARGKTAEEMASVLRLPEGSPAEGYRSLSNSL
ncbi:MAG: serpin family protein, partial [Candidatus Korarchaeum sp.]